MKRISSFFAVMLTLNFCNAQITDGMYATDFHLYEVDTAAHAVDTSHTIDLYSMLDDYKTVFIHIASSTCASCGVFHQTGTFQTLISNYGPGTAADDTRALVLEAKSGYSWEALSGQLEGNYWDMTENNNFPLIPLRMEPNYPNLFNSFKSNYPYIMYPTRFFVCPNRIIYSLEHDGDTNTNNVAEEWHDYALEKCPCITHNNAAYLVPNSSNLALAYFCDYEFTPMVTLQNLGTDTLTSATIIASFNNHTDTLQWIGVIPQLGFEELTFPTMSGFGDGDLPFTFTVVTVNGVANEDSIHNSDTYFIRLLSEGQISTIEEGFSGFEYGNELPEGWTALEHPEACFTYSYVSHDSLDVLFFEPLFLKLDAKCEIAMPLFDFSNTDSPMLQFDLAYWQRHDTLIDRLEVLYSIDCGNTWITAYEKSGAELSKTGIVTQQSWLPDSVESFRTDSAMLSQAANQQDVVIKFVYTSGRGNNLTIDNVKVFDASPVSINVIQNSELTIYPVPTADVLYINYEKAIKQLDVYDINGRCVGRYGNVQRSINVSNLSSGTYILNFITEEGLIVKKFVKE